MISGTGVAYGDSNRTYKIGQVWKEGSTPASYSVSLGFATPGPVKINGGIQQTPTSGLRGSPRPPFKHELDVFSRNFANGWWQASCAPDCVGTGGSTSFQGSVVEGLWEFPQSMSVMVSDFVMVGLEEDLLLQSHRLSSVSSAKAAGLRVVTAILTVAVLLVACDADDGEPDEAGPESTTTTGVVPEGDPPEGRFFAVAGERSLDADLYELLFSPVRLERLTEGSRVGAVGACPELLVVAAAQQEVGFADTVQAFSGGSLGPVEGLGTPNGSAATLTADCRIAYLAVDRDTPELIDRLHVWDPKTRSDRVLHSAPELAGIDVGPDGRVAAIETTQDAAGQPAASTAIVIVSSDGASRSIPALAADLGVLRWGPSRRMAVSRIAEKSTLFLDPESGERSELPGWFPLAWSPDGGQLLVSDAVGHRTLGLVDASDLSTVRKLGTARVGVYDVAWLPADAP